MKGDLYELAWPAAALGEAIAALARHSGFLRSAVQTPALPDRLADHSGDGLGRWIEQCASALGLEAEPVVAPYSEADRLVRGAAPALLRLPRQPYFLALVGVRRQAALILAPDLGVHRVKLERLQATLRREIEAPVAAKVEQLLIKAGVPRRRRAKARSAILCQQVGHIWINDGWLLRLPPSASFLQQARQAKLLRRLRTVVIAHLLEYALLIGSWWLIGRSVLRGQLEYGWLFAWIILLLTAVPFRLLAAWSQGLFAIGAGSLLKQKLLYGALRLDPEAIKRQGAGQLLGRVIESSAVESLALNGGFLCLIASIEMILAAVILSLGAGGLFHAVLLMLWSALAMGVGWRYFRRRLGWTATRLAMTNDLVERMVGHRTRLAQQQREQWHEDEDQAIESYQAESTALDRIVMMQTGVARGWIVLALGGLIPAFVSGGHSPGLLAVSLGGILLASRGLTKLSAGMQSLLGAAIAWKQIAPLFRAADQKEIASPLAEGNSAGQAPAEGQPLLEAWDLVFRYPDRGEAVLRGCHLKIRSGDRLLLRGSSGGGKSTFASLLAGLRSPTSGLLLLHGLDWQTLGARGWRERVASAPQFHENHVLTETFAFNLLMGRRWPPLAEDLEAAETICRALGLGDLLERMPAGMLQMVGETGWQLSHGERSRLFMARALLQNASLIILDESFAALDPETLRQCLQCVTKRAATLMVIAHP